MTVGFDNQANFFNGSGGITDANTPGATLRGVVVMIMHDTTSDQITGVTYGGVAMARIRRDVESAGSIGFSIYTYFLGASIPAGTQDVVITRTGSSNLLGETFGITGAADTEVVDHDGRIDTVANPSLTLQYAGRTCITFAFMAHQAAVANVTSAGGTQTRELDLDQGSWCVVFAHQTTPGSSDFTIGYTITGSATEENCMSAVAVSEVSSGPAGVWRSPWHQLGPLLAH